MINPLEIGLGLTAERTQPWIAINRLGSWMNSRNENHGMRSMNWSPIILRDFNVRSVTIWDHLVKTEIEDWVCWVYLVSLVQIVWLVYSVYWVSGEIDVHARNLLEKDHS